MRNEGGRRGSWEKASDRGDKVTRDGEGQKTEEEEERQRDSIYRR